MRDSTSRTPRAGLRVLEDKSGKEKPYGLKWVLKKKKVLGKTGKEGGNPLSRHRNRGCPGAQ